MVHAIHNLHDKYMLKSLEKESLFEHVFIKNQTWKHCWGFYASKLKMRILLCKSKREVNLTPLLFLFVVMSIKYHLCKSFSRENKCGKIKVKANEKGICEFVGYELFDYKVLEIDVQL